MKVERAQGNEGQKHIFHPFLKIKRKKSPLHNFTVLIPTHLQTSLTLKS